MMVMMGTARRSFASDSSSAASSSSHPNSDACLHTLRVLLDNIQARRLQRNDKDYSTLQKEINSNGCDSDKSLSVQELSTNLCRQYLDLYHSNSSVNDLEGAQATNSHREEHKRDFLLELAVKAKPDADSVMQIVRSLLKDGGNSVDSSNLKIRKLRIACVPKYEMLFHTLLAEAEHCIGMKFLVSLRYDIMNTIKFESSARTCTDLDIQALKYLDEDLKRMLVMWFSSGILELRRISFDQTPASIIETIARNESVHPLKDLNDLKKRLGENRRCYAFFHPSLQDEPLVFVHVALLPTIAKSMEEIDKLTKASTHDQYYNLKSNFDPHCAVFYSINSTKRGLNGVELGTLLIKRVCSMLKTDYPDIHTFSTLSPIPGFRKWLEGKLLHSGPKFVDDNLVTLEEKQKLASIFECESIDVPRKLCYIHERSGWYKEEALLKILKPLFMRLAAQYLTVEKHRNRPLDPVARFHCKNGAEMYQLNWLADLSRKGMHQSMGMMINYRYSLETIEENHFRYEDGGNIQVLKGVLMWLSHEHNRCSKL